jgi:hypothetical protein
MDLSDGDVHQHAEADRRDVDQERSQLNHPDGGRAGVRSSVGLARFELATLDAQIGGLVVSCDPKLRFKDCGGG